MNKLFRIPLVLVAVVYSFTLALILILVTPRKTWREIKSSADAHRRLRSAYLDQVTDGLCDPKQITSKDIIGEKDGFKIVHIRTNESLAFSGGACVSPMQSFLGDKFYVIAVTNQLPAELANCFLAHELGHIYAGVTRRRTWWCLDEVVARNVRLVDELAADAWAIRHYRVKIHKVFNLRSFIGTPIAVAVRYIRARKIERELGIK